MIPEACRETEPAGVQPPRGFFVAYDGCEERSADARQGEFVHLLMRNQERARGGLRVRGAHLSPFAAGITKRFAGSVCHSELTESSTPAPLTPMRPARGRVTARSSNHGVLWASVSYQRTRRSTEWCENSERNSQYGTSAGDPAPAKHPQCKGRNRIVTSCGGTRASCRRSRD